jgi:rhamnosyltransferase subunit B
MEYLLVTFGSAGDVHPFVGLGRALRARGHAVTVITFDHYEPLVRRAGLDFGGLPSLTRERRRPPSAGVLRRSGRTLAKVAFRPWLKLGRASTVLPLLRPVYEAILTRFRPGRTAVVASSVALGARIARDQLGMPLATVHLTPVLFRSVYRPPVQPPFVLPRWAPHWARRAAYRALDALVLDPLLAPAINELRTEVGLTPIHRVFDSWRHSPDQVLGLFPSWFAAPQPDWPALTRLTTFPRFDEAGLGPPAADLDELVEAGGPPIVFAGGSERRDLRAFFRAAVEACQALARPGLLLTRYPEQLPEHLPARVRHVPYLPFSQILPRAAALVHHGGIGTTAQALAAGIPQVVVPRHHDQFENASRLVELGVSRTLSARQAQAGALPEALNHVLTSTAVAGACQTARQRLAAERPLEQTCSLLEELGATRTAAA